MLILRCKDCGKVFDGRFSCPRCHAPAETSDLSRGKRQAAKIAIRRSGKSKDIKEEG